MKHQCGNGIRLLWAIAALSLLPVTSALPEEKGNEAKWSFSPAVGWMDFDGAEQVKDAPLLTLRLGYDWSEALTFEGSLYYAPYLPEQTVGKTTYDPVTGAVTSYDPKHSRLSDTDPTADKSMMLGGAVDGLFHLTRWERLDPFLTLGVGMLWFDANMHFGHWAPELRYGGGVMYHFNDEWAIRAEGRGFFKEGGQDRLKCSSLIEAGVVWTWGARIPPKAATGGWVPEIAPAVQPAKLVSAPVPTPNDLQMFELVINFGEGEWKVGPEYFSELDAVAKAIQAHPGSDIRIEGHVDKLPPYTESDAVKLTQKRAEAVRDYLVEKHQIARKRLLTVGCGFACPKALNDPAIGNPENRRIEIHIRPEVNSK